jgi:hypothetical protein
MGQLSLLGRESSIGTKQQTTIAEIKSKEKGRKINNTLNSRCVEMNS